MVEVNCPEESSLLQARVRLFGVSRSQNPNHEYMGVKYSVFSFSASSLSKLAHTLLKVIDR